MSRAPIPLLIASLLVGACSRTPAPPPQVTASTPAAAPTVPDVSASVTATAEPSPDLLSMLGNASYNGIEDQPITLTKGLWQGDQFDEDSASRPSMRAMAEVSPVPGDLDGDGLHEAVAFVAYDGGGSGVFVHLAVFKLQDGQAVNIATADVGDRVRIEKAAIEDGRIVVETIESGPNDPACCPATKARHVWSLVDGALKEADADASIEAP